MSDRERTPNDALTALLTTGDMARRAESTLRTVRFYEEEGLITPIARGEGGQRYFAPTELAKLALARDLREAGLSVQDVRTLFDLKSGCQTPAEASRRMGEALEGQIAELQQKIDKLRALRAELASMASVVAECESCSDPRFGVECASCDVMTQPEAPRALQVLWRDVPAAITKDVEEPGR